MTTILPIDEMIDTDRGRISREIFVAPDNFTLTVLPEVSVT